MTDIFYESVFVLLLGENVEVFLGKRVTDNTS